jgi:hypothetical protein
MVGYIFQPEGKVLGIVLGRARLSKGDNPWVEGQHIGEIIRTKSRHHLHNHVPSPGNENETFVHRYISLDRGTKNNGSNRVCVTEHQVQINIFNCTVIE